MIGLLLPFWLNLEDGGGGPVLVHHDAPGERYLMCEEAARVMSVESNDRALFVDSEPREMQC